MTPSRPGTEEPDRLAAHLGRLRDQLRPAVFERPDGLESLRPELEALRAEAEGLGRSGLARALGRLALLTEVWGCLAAESPDSAPEAAAFCIRALDHLAVAGDDASWIIEESSARWSDYLGLIDPGVAEERDAGDFTTADTYDDVSPPAIDAETLVRLLTAGATADRTDELETAAPSDLIVAPEGRPSVARGTSPWEGGGTAGRGSRAPEGRQGEENCCPSGAASAECLAPFQGLAPLATDGRPSGATDQDQPDSRSGPRNTSPDLRFPALSPESEGKQSIPAPTIAELAVPTIDPECREAFLAEAGDLFERLETLVLSLGRGDDPASVLHELGRCLHTLKGAAGSVGLSDLAKRIHRLEGRLEDASGRASPELIDQLHQSLSHLESVLVALRQTPGRSPAPEADRRESPPAQSWRISPPLPSEPAVSGPPPAAATAAEVADGPLRVPSGRIDELMDLASELILRRGAWAAQADRLKAFAGQIRACRDELRARLDRLDELGITRASRAGDSGRGQHAVAEVLASSEAATVVLRLAEQVEDLAVLTESVQAQALPLADDSDTLARLSLQLWETLQSIRIVPVRGLFQRLARVAHDAARVEGREVEVVMLGEETGLDRAVQDKAFEPLLHVVRNAVGHGIEPPEGRIEAGKPPRGRVTLGASREGSTLVLTVQDDGRGLDDSAIATKARRLGLIGPDETPSHERLAALIFVPGFSTRTEANAISGRGVGMDVVAQEVRRLRGTIDLTSQPGRGTRITLRLPARLALEQAMIARVAGRLFAIPLTQVEHAQPFEPGDVVGKGRDAHVLVRDRRVPLLVAREALGFSANAPASCPKLLLVRAEGEALALLFDAIEGTRELIIKPLGPLLAGHPVIGGTSLSLNGDVIFVLNPSGLIRWHREARPAAVPAPGVAAQARPAPVLVVDDSISVRRVVTRQFRRLGLEVEEVSDGVEALGRLSSRSYSMVLTDLEMPRMDGFELLAELQRSPALAALPVVVASTESRPATRRRALALGARAFVAKPIDQDELARVIGTVLNRANGPS